MAIYDSQADSDLADLRKQCIESLYLCTDNVLKYLDSEKDAELAEMRACAKNYCLLEVSYQMMNEAFAKTQRDADASNVDRLDEIFDEHIHNLEQRKLNVCNHPFMVEFDKRVKNIQEALAQNSTDTDLAVTGTTQVYIDPITMIPIENPVKNRICGHIYESESILAYIGTGQHKCPMIGCGNKKPLRADGLVACDERSQRQGDPKVIVLDDNY